MWTVIDQNLQLVTGRVENLKFFTMRDVGGEVLFSGEIRNGKVCRGIVKYNSGDEYDLSEYDGGLLNGLKHGQGKMTYAQPKIHGENGILKPMEKEHGYQESYEGMWENDRQHGSGILLFSNGGSYKGEFKNGRYNGHGIITKEFSGCSSYINGQILPHDNSYNGEWLDGARNGYGESYEILHYDFNGGEPIPLRTIYKGNWENNNKHGLGTQVYQNGDIYEGEWKDDVQHGSGKLTCHNGDVYEGEWLNGLKHGQGKMTYAQPKIHGENGILKPMEKEHGYQESYEGMWKDDVQHGSGILKCSNGDVYEGQWTDDQLDGPVKLINSNGDVYGGLWSNGFWNKWDNVEFTKYANRMTMRYADGSFYECKWYHEEFNEKVFIYDNKDKTKNTYFFQGINLNGASKKANLFMALFGSKTQKPEDAAQNVFEELQSLLISANTDWEIRRLK